jgi:hypothetical protein
MLKRNLFVLFSFTLFCLASTLLCISNYNPFSATQYEFTQFYGSFFGATLGVSALIIYYLKTVVFKKEQLLSYFAPSVRQGTFISLSLTAALILKGIGMFDLWTIVPIAIIFLLLEAFFQTKKVSLDTKKA